MSQTAMVTLRERSAERNPNPSTPPATCWPSIPPYTYKPLDRSADCIRLLVLDAYSLSSYSSPQPITCRLVTAKFADRPKYEALSYTWGSPDNFGTIIVDGHEMVVGQNLLLALQSLFFEGRVLWVDAICINQSDLEERNEQVSLMAFIYSRAQTVLVWLGKLSITTESTADVTEGGDFLKEICSHDYWSRVWIVQEIALAKKISCVYELNCQQYCVDWTPFMENLSFWKGFEGALPFKLKKQREGRHGDTSRLEMLLANFSDAQCNEPRDKIYGFLGMAHDCQNDSIPVDYSKSLVDLYREVIKFHQLSKPMTHPLPGKIDRAMRLVAFSRVLQQLFEGRIEAEFKNSDVELSASILDKHPLTARGLIEGAVIHLGPSYDDVVSSFRETKKWKASFDQYYHTSEDLSFLRLLDEVYTSALLEMDERVLAKIRRTRSFDTESGDNSATVSSYKWIALDFAPELEWEYNECLQSFEMFKPWELKRVRIENSILYSVPPINSDTPRRSLGNTPRRSLGSTPRRFLGSNRTMGLVPREAQEGDLICRFWGCDVAAVLRWVGYKNLFHIVGRAHVATGWQEAESQSFTINIRDELEGGGVMDISLDIKTLQELTA
jgi:hypothetical protein